MQDEINEKVVALSVKGAKLTAETLQKAIKTMLAQAKKQQEKQPHGKQTLKQLAKQNAGLSNIEIRAWSTALHVGVHNFKCK